MALDRNRLLKPARKLRKLVNKIDGKPSPDEVHDFRTNTRRFEATFEVLTLDLHSMGTSVLKKLARCRKRAGKVRDLDVLTGYASTVHLQGEDNCETHLLTLGNHNEIGCCEKAAAWRAPVADEATEADARKIGASRSSERTSRADCGGAYMSCLRRPIPVYPCG